MTEEAEESNKLSIKPKIRKGNREYIRRKHKFLNTKQGYYTKPSLGARKRKRRALKKVGNRTRKNAR
jgi:hypothetical protein